MHFRQVESGAPWDIAAYILLANPATTLISPFIMASKAVLAASDAWAFSPLPTLVSAMSARSKKSVSSRAPHWRAAH